VRRSDALDRCGGIAFALASDGATITEARTRKAELASPKQPPFLATCLRESGSTPFEVRRVRRFHSTTVGLHAQEVRKFLGNSLAVRAGASRNGNSVLPEQAGQVRGLREILRPFSSRHSH